MDSGVSSHMHVVLDVRFNSMCNKLGLLLCGPTCSNVTVVVHCGLSFEKNEGAKDC